MKQPFLVRMGGNAVQTVYLRRDIYLLAENVYGLFTVEQSPSKRPFNLITDEENRTFLAPEIIF